MKNKLSTIACIIAVVLLGLYISSCSANEREQKDAIYEEGYRDGYRDGEYDGYHNALREYGIEE